jgi:CheY-like chemotaxis protein
MLLENIFISVIGAPKTNIFSAQNGYQAFQKATQQQMDLIIMDLNMPIMDGFTAARKIKDFYKKDSYIFFSEMEGKESLNIQ